LKLDGMVIEKATQDSERVLKIGEAQSVSYFTTILVYRGSESW
jgi:precorrin-2 methylase